MPARINKIMNSRHERWKIGAGKYNAQKFQERLKAYFENPTICKCCQKPIEYKLRRNKFCGHSCSAKFTNSRRPTTKGKVKEAFCKLCKIKITVSLHTSQQNTLCFNCKTIFKKPIKIRKMRNKSLKIVEKSFIEKQCIICGCQFLTLKKARLTCSDTCTKTARNNGASKGGKISAAKQSTKRRSKNESYFASLCEGKFNILTNKPYFNGWDADIIIPELKVAILWNGAWHYKKITKKHSVKQVQNRDKIKIKEIIKQGYTPYIIKDLGSKNYRFVEEQYYIFCEFVKKLQETVPPCPRHSL